GCVKMSDSFMHWMIRAAATTSFSSAYRKKLYLARIYFMAFYFCSHYRRFLSCKNNAFILLAQRWSVLVRALDNIDAIASLGYIIAYVPNRPYIMTKAKPIVPK